MKTQQFCPQCAKPLYDKPYEGSTRRACPDTACGYVHWDNPVPVVAAVIEYQGKILLARNALWPAKFFALITGFLEKDDPNPATAVVREVKEETNLDATSVSLIGHYDFKRLNQIIIAYHVRAEGEVKLNEELVDYRLVEFDKIKIWPSGTGYALRDWLKAAHNIEAAEMAWPKG
jgi:NADH pyrophosphatase NudC (nudix superfamily)